MAAELEDARLEVGNYRALADTIDANISLKAMERDIEQHQRESDVSVV